ncbi:MAG TPA: PHP domain-containing protein [Patescibacteria group bacterium]|nr:PHP domain-containing protein [Patescibacteria group bacterium]
MELDNGAISELLAREAENANETLRRAYKRAARAAFLWPAEARTLFEAGESLTTLAGIGPYLERQLKNWIESPPKDTEPPAIRRNFLTLSRARRILSRQPDWPTAYRGDLQMHSRWSDGSATIRQMAKAGQERGYEYIAITDHSQGLKIAGGISPDELCQQAREIQRMNEQFNKAGSFRVLRSIELNLNPQGQGDMENECLDELDLVVGSFHSRLREKEDQTARYLAALANRHVTILGHPVGRIYNHRLGLPADWTRVCARAAQLDKALEIDSYPDRQDLSTELLKIARAEGTRIAIDTDAHSPEQLGFVELGLAAALEVGIARERIVNFMAATDLLAWAAELKAATTGGTLPQMFSRRRSLKHRTPLHAKPRSQRRAELPGRQI